MRIVLSFQEKEVLETQHRKEQDRRVADRIKAVLLCAEGWMQKQIAQALRIRYETAQDHLENSKNSKKLEPENGGSQSLLKEDQTSQLIAHLESNTYIKVQHICCYVEQPFGVKFTGSGMTKWLTRNNFSYKKPKGTPAKANPEKQAAFIKYYEELLNTVPEDEPIGFADASHPTVTINSYETIDSQAMEKRLKRLLFLAFAVTWLTLGYFPYANFPCSSSGVIICTWFVVGGSQL